MCCTTCIQTVGNEHDPHCTLDTATAPAVHPHAHPRAQQEPAPAPAPVPEPFPARPLPAASAGASLVSAPAVGSSAGVFASHRGRDGLGYAAADGEPLWSETEAKLAYGGDGAAVGRPGTAPVAGAGWLGLLASVASHRTRGWSLGPGYAMAPAAAGHSDVVGEGVRNGDAAAAKRDAPRSRAAGRPLARPSGPGPDRNVAVSGPATPLGSRRSFFDHLSGALADAATGSPTRDADGDAHVDIGREGGGSGSLSASDVTPPTGGAPMSPEHAGGLDVPSSSAAGRPAADAGGGGRCGGGEHSDHQQGAVLPLEIDCLDELRHTPGCNRRRRRWWFHTGQAHCPVRVVLSGYCCVPCSNRPRWTFERGPHHPTCRSPQLAQDKAGNVWRGRASVEQEIPPLVADAAPCRDSPPEYVL